MKLPILVPILAAAIATSSAGSSDDLKAESPLTRPTGAPDPDAHGKVRAEHDLEKNRHKLDLEAEDVDTSLVFEAWLEDGSGQLQMVGVMQLDQDPGQVEIDFDSEEDLPLPFGAATVEELAGRAVEVRSGGQTYLVGTVPALDGSSGGSGSGSGSGGDWIKSKAPLVRPPAAPDPDAKGYVEIRFRAKDNHQKFKVEAEHVDTSVSFSVFLEIGAGAGVLELVGAMQPEDAGEVELEIETEDGDPLPFGVAKVDELSGRMVEVRDGGGAVYLTGVVPALGVSMKNDQAKAMLQGDGKAEIKVKAKPKKAEHRFELKVSDVEAGLALELWIIDPAQSALVKAADIAAGSNGKATYKVNTKKGEALPLGATTVDAPGGLAVEVRHTDGTIRFTGVVPEL